MADVMDYISTHLEKVSTDIPEIYRSMQSQFAQSVLASAEAVTVSRYLYRVALKKWHGGNMEKVSGNAGVFPQGTGPSYAEMRAGYFYSMRAWTLTDEMIDTMSSGEQAVVDVMSEYLSGAMKEVAQDDELSVFNNGQGALTNASSAATSTTITFAVATDTLGVNQLRQGLPVDVWSAVGAGGTKRAPSSGTAPTFITGINFRTRVVTLNQAIASIAAGDILTIRGLDVYGPSTLTSGAEAWPMPTGGVGSQVAAGLGGDSFRHGIRYINDSEDSTYYGGLLKSTYPSYIAHEIPAAGAPLDWGHGRVLQDAVMTARGIEQWSVEGVAPLAQRKAFEDLGINITSIAMTGPNDLTQNVDLAAMNRDLTGTFNYAGMQNRLAICQPNDRIDYVEMSGFRRAMLHDVRFVEGGDGGGTYLWRDRDATTARPTKARSLYTESCYDLFHMDPGMCGYISGLKVPTGYAGGSGSVLV